MCGKIHNEAFQFQRGHIRFLTRCRRTKRGSCWFSDETRCGESQKDENKKGNESCEISGRNMFQTWEEIMDIKVQRRINC